MNSAATPHELTRLTRAGETTRNSDLLVTEAPVEFRLGGVPLAVLMRTPGHDEELGLGFAITEGIVLNPNEVVEVVPAGEPDDGDRWSLVLRDGVAVDPEQFRRNLYTTSSCGVCGKASIDAVRVAALRPPPGPRVTVETLFGLVDTMQAAQQSFAATGGIHGAGLFTAEGELIVLREDIGRHNAVDKVVGHASRLRWPIGERILLISGRVTVSAASSLAVELAEELGLTVIGFLRDDSCNVYTDPGRIL
jgi:FdhD protein